MCTIPPAPPPPPVASNILPDSHSTTKSSSNNSHEYSKLCEWAGEDPELQEACTKNNLGLHTVPFKHKYNKFKSILQVGPTCGLVALSMLVNGAVPPDEILNITKSEGYTYNGEMFSCKYMAKIVEKVFNLANIENVKCSVKIGGLFSPETIEKLLEGAVLLVPYDSDRNHTPCLKNGHTAHWALICGVIILEEPSDSYETKPENVYVFSRHGKSKYLAAWNLKELAKSNRNLWEFSPKRGAEKLPYLLPEGGIGGTNGLRNQFLMFEGLN
ncbi:actin maturation protease [Ostrinia nubilalis]|uniref:actin maturation protease n=1 Tax=Ostrinia nubilalis TaxID=29057 RepID=UPI00308235C3